MRKVLIAILLLLSACNVEPQPGPPPVTSPWASALRALDLSDTNNPSNDITAVYLRQQDDALQIRIDLLDFQDPNGLSIEIQIGDDAAPEAEPLTVRIPSQTGSTRSALDPGLSTVTVDIPLSKIPSNPRVDVSTPEDEIRGLTLDGPVPAQRAPLLLTFYQAFAGRFPAEALRSWDGAHTGPRGERHGLKHLLDAVEEHQIPVFLLDLKEPENLSALDAMGALPRVREGANRGLYLLADTGSTYDFYLPSSPFLYASSLSLLEYDIYFAFLQDSTHVYRSDGTTYIPIATATDLSQPTPDGPSLAVRRMLLETALNDDEQDMIVLGGSLADSTWGSPDMVGATLAYFASRPYIHVLNEGELANFPARTDTSISPKLPEPVLEMTEETQSTLEFAISWAGSPSESSTNQCQSGSTGNPLSGCILANNNYLAIFDPQGGKLTHLFSRTESGGMHQFIGPSRQVFPELDLYPGAFADDQEYLPTIDENTLVFTSINGSRMKTFTLTESGLEVTYQTQEPVNVEIPLLVDPWRRFSPGWAQRYVQEDAPGGIAWGLENGPAVSITLLHTQRDLKISTFNGSLSLLSEPEDPDFDYPPGHYLPFPMAVAEGELQDGYFLRLERLP